MNPKIISAILTMVGTETPAFVALYNEFIEAMRERDTEALKVLLHQWNLRAEVQHQDAQRG